MVRGDAGRIRDDAACKFSRRNPLSWQLEYTFSQPRGCAVSGLDNRYSWLSIRHWLGLVLDSFKDFSLNFYTNVGEVDISTPQDGSVNVAGMEILNPGRDPDDLHLRFMEDADDLNFLD